MAAVERIHDRYDVLRRLGAGGMGDVWEADDLRLGRKVAIKFVGEKELRENPGAASVLSDEARNAGQLLGHPHVVSVLDLIDVETAIHQGPAIVLEFMDGCHVGEWIQQYAPRLDEFTRTEISLYIAMQSVDALHFAHKRNILHRDVKPQNILLSTTGGVKVADFGLSRVVEEITRTHTVWGRHTPLYAAPEQWRDEKPDKATDVYQLAASLYHIFAGVPANSGTSLIGLLRWHESETPVALTDHIPNMDIDVAAAIHEGLDSDPARRPSLWTIFDALSNARAKRLNMEAIVEVAEDGSHEALAKEVANFTDFSEENLVAGGRSQATFPHPMEAVQEAIGVILLGGSAKLAVPATATETEPEPASGADAPVT